MLDSTQQFESYRRLLFSIAYRMLGSAMAAEDMVQESYLRFQALPAESIRSPKALLSTIITRLCINSLQSARAQRETYIGPWLPEPVRTGEEVLQSSTDHAALDESISMAFLVLLETLTPTERAVFLLREVFEYEYAEIAEIIGQEEAACRQLFSRARKHITENRPRFKASPEQHRRVLDQFINVVQGGELSGLIDLLAADVTMWADGGGKARGAATKILHGADAVARFVRASTSLPTESYSTEIAELNGEPALLLSAGGHVFAALFITVEDARVSEIRAIGNPDKLRWL